MKYLVLFSVFFHLYSHAQETQIIRDQQQLDQMEYEDLLDIFNVHETDSITAEKIARTYLNRARQERDTIKMARAYDRLARIFHPRKNIQFADSIIVLTQDMEHITYPAQGYILKAFCLMEKDDIKGAYENNLAALKFARNRKNMSQQIYIIDRLVFMQNSWGSANKALKLQKRRDSIINRPSYKAEVLHSTREGYRDNIDQIILTNRIISSHSFAYCYLKSENIDSAMVHIDHAFDLLNKYSGNNKTEYLHWTYDILMEYYYLKQDYCNSIKVGDKILDRYGDMPSTYATFNVNLFQGLSYLKMDSIDNSFRHLKISDSIFEHGNPDVMPQYNRMLFTGLREYYAIKDELKPQIEYLDKIIRIDSILQDYYIYFEPNHISRFETPELLGQKEKLIFNLKSQNKKTATINIWIIVCLIICLLSLIYYINKQIRYAKRFKALLAEGSVSNDRMQKTVNTSTNEISGDIIKTILSSLNEFELKRGFLKSRLSLNSLAKKFDTNPNYLSRVVNLKKGVNFSQYIHDLRINYALEELLCNPYYRKYTIKAIAEECGYSNGESFSKAFRKKTGIYPSYYIKKLEKHEGKN